jgi:hypothetical protein
MTKKDLEAAVVAELATMEAGLIEMERALNNVIHMQQRLRDDPTADGSINFKELEGMIAQARKDIREGRASQERWIRRLATGDWTSPNVPDN